jgi:hypothetical protein
MYIPTALEHLYSGVADRCRTRRRLAPEVRPLEGRQLLSGSGISATMTQTATFPYLESSPNVATSAFLYFSPTIGTLTEVDVVASGSYTSQFHAENVGPTSSTIVGTTSAHLSINVPTGSIPVTIPALTDSFTASPFDRKLDDSGTSGKAFAPQTSSSAPQTTVCTSPAELAAFNGNFRIPISVSGHATGSATSSNGNGDLSAGFSTQTSVTLTIIYHYDPNLPSLDPPTTTAPNPQPPGGSGSGNVTPTPSNPPPATTHTNPAPTTPVAAASSAQALPSTPTQHAVTHSGKKRPAHVTESTHHRIHLVPVRLVRRGLVARFDRVKSD